MPDANLFSMLSAYRPGSAATPFENYCTTALAYFLRRGHRMLTALFAQAAGAYGEQLVLVEVQPELLGTGFLDLVLTFEGGRVAIVETRIEPAPANDWLERVGAAGAGWDATPALVLLALTAQEGPAPWQGIPWIEIAEALDGDPDPLAAEFSEFVLRDVLGLGEVPLDEAITTNRLYALGAAAVRRAYGNRAEYVNSASRPIQGRYRYIGTTFGLDGGPMEHWIGLINEGVPLSEHYHLMIGSKSAAVDRPAEMPRVTSDWKWPAWSGAGRVVRPLGADAYGELLARLHTP